MIQKIKENIENYFVGKEEVIENLLICLLAGGHVLFEDVPGVGKTTLARTLSNTIDATFGRIQFTPDTLPSDVTGVSVYNSGNGKFEYREGAVMKQIVLADEINRTSPKTQAALLEAMCEGQVTVDGEKHLLPEEFMVIATQNPVEFLGTYPLPEAQLDRFMMRLSIGYPDPASEVKMARNMLEGKTLESVKSVCNVEDILSLKKEVREVKVSDKVLEYIDEIVNLTRKAPEFVLGASPRAMLSLVMASKAKAFLAGRNYVKPDDVKAVSVNVLHHRMTLSSEAKIRKESVDRVLTALILKAKVPME